MINSFGAELNKVNAYDLAYRIATSSGILGELILEKEKGPEEVERLQNIEELLAGIQEFVTTSESDEFKSIADFMIDVALLTDADQDKTDERNHVSLMTIHASKGLEFPYVFIVGLEENLFPSQMVLNTRSELEEERRLFYVAVTRAMIACCLSYASSRYTWGQVVSCEPSRFIDEIEPNYLTFDSPPRGTGRSLMNGNFERPFNSGLPRQSSGVPGNLKSLNELNKVAPKNTDSLHLMVGFNVEHERFGKGKVTHIEGLGADKKAIIFFPHHGSKTVLLRFANLKVID
jgi:DNA helicase-2/ATP-dependent DNA helicase PcrA